MYNISAIRALYEQGYRIKQIQLITGYRQSYISRAKDNERAIPTMETASEEILRRKQVLDTILAAHPLLHFEFNNQDVAYIQLLCFCLVDKEIIYNMYPTSSRYKINVAMRQKDISYTDFDASELSIDDKDWQLFLESAKLA